jgi:hypothetical protein
LTSDFSKTSQFFPLFPYHECGFVDPEKVGFYLIQRLTILTHKRRHFQINRSSRRETIKCKRHTKKSHSSSMHDSQESRARMCECVCVYNVERSQSHCRQRDIDSLTHFFFFFRCPIKNSSKINHRLLEKFVFIRRKKVERERLHIFHVTEMIMIRMLTHVRIHVCTQ